jgi:hypothetical protein
MTAPTRVDSAIPAPKMSRMGIDSGAGTKKIRAIS